MLMMMNAGNSKIFLIVVSVVRFCMNYVGFRFVRPSQLGAEAAQRLLRLLRKGNSFNIQLQYEKLKTSKRSIVSGEQSQDYQRINSAKPRLHMLCLQWPAWARMSKCMKRFHTFPNFPLLIMVCQFFFSILNS